MVTAVMPGPLQGTTYQSPSIWRGDLLISVNGQATSAEGWKQFVSANAPGTAVTIVYRRSKSPDPTAAMPRGDPGGQDATVTFNLDPRSRWEGTLGMPRRQGQSLPEAVPGEFESLIMARADQLQITAAPGGIGALAAALTELRENNPDPGEIFPVANAFRRPLGIDAVEKPLAAAAREALRGEIGPVLGLINQVLDNPMLPDAVLRLPAWFAPRVGAVHYGPARAELEQLVRHHRDDVTIGVGDRVRTNIAALRRGMELGPVLSHLADLAPSAHASLVQIGAAHAQAAARTDLPPEIRAAVTGDVLFFDPGLDGQGPLVVGGPGQNTYDMSKLARVYDVGGDDIYRYLPGDLFAMAAGLAADGQPVPTRVIARVIIDLGGNDVHESQGDFAGPAVGFMGLSILDDHQGNDTYRASGQGSIAAGVLGLGILIDRGGTDTYINTGGASGWSIGAGYFGAGIVLDLGGDDSYIGEKLVQGVAGPRGFGAIIDASGNDLYRAVGTTFPSAYGTPGVSLGMSQGFGCGIRGYAQGGLGAIWDFGGDDRYEAGEFSQACGYFWSMGLLHDFGGHDMYLAARYSQGSAAHQAAGLLIDDSGDDTYWGMTGASQGAAWDQSIGVLIDRAGNDSYRAGGLSQGSAAQQAIGLLIDLAGNDRYSAYAPAQGESGGNEYHYHEWKIFSFSALFDLGGGNDTYTSPSRANATTLKTGSVNEQAPATSPAWGIAVDE